MASSLASMLLIFPEHATHPLLQPLDLEFVIPTSSNPIFHSTEETDHAGPSHLKCKLPIANFIALRQLWGAR